MEMNPGQRSVPEDQSKTRQTREETVTELRGKYSPQNNEIYGNFAVCHRLGRMMGNETLNSLCGRLGLGVLKIYKKNEIKKKHRKFWSEMNRDWYPKQKENRRVEKRQDCWVLNVTAGLTFVSRAAGV